MTCRENPSTARLPSGEVDNKHIRSARLGGEPYRTPAQLTGNDGTASVQLARDCNNRSVQHTGDVSKSRSPSSPASLQGNVIKNEANDAAHYSRIDDADQSMVENMPTDKVVQSMKKELKWCSKKKLLFEILCSRFLCSNDLGS